MTFEVCGDGPLTNPLGGTQGSYSDSWKLQTWSTGIECWRNV
jgi:hypothetical protein